MLKSIRTVDRPQWGIGILITMSLILLGSQSAYAQTALPNVACPTNLGSCTAGDVTTTVVGVVPAVSDPTCSGPNDTIDLEITLEYVSTAATKYDFGVFIATDGGALNGTPAGDPAATACVGAAAMVGDGNSPKLFVDEDSDTQPGDTCGDIKKSIGPAEWTVSATVACDIQNNELTVGSCRVWKQNTGTVCTGLSQAGTGSKCDCTALVLSDPGGLEFGTLEVVKDLEPAGDPGLFNLEIDGVANATDIGDGGTTGAVTVNTGVHTIGETAGTGTDLADYTTTYSCTDGTDTTTTTSVNVDEGEAWVCTITNTKDTTLVSLAGLQATATNEGTTVSWTTITEIDSAGFNIYSSNSADGPWVQVNDEMIPAAGDSSTLTDYAFSDANGAAYYMLESVDTSGEVTQQGPINADGFSGTNSSSRTIFLPMF